MNKLNFNQKNTKLKEIAEDKFKKLAYKSLVSPCTGLFYEPKVPKALLKTNK
ncbi:cyclic lactone autoinducer peptide [Listeria grandensis]|uniref:Cyclic lactone autoinducer peptide n=1 Tax=Listeria grandensis TaxID=1494963 RepID=A0A7X0Y519_9LIST|nr:cyclic lactone autoinducer peptide [Listeria grandensis]MBC1936903.1 cyclic lactone autoinducer peptide [Listeria grandensis]